MRSFKAFKESRDNSIDESVAIKELADRLDVLMAILFADKKLNDKVLNRLDGNTKAKIKRLIALIK